MRASDPGLLGQLVAEVGQQAIGESIRSHLLQTSELDIVSSMGIAPVALSILRQARTGPGVVLVVTATARAADDCCQALQDLLPSANVVTFPSWETLPHERLSPRSDTVGRRLAVLRRLRHPVSRRESTAPDDGASGSIGDQLSAVPPIAARSGAEIDGRIDVVVASIRAVLQPIIRGLGEIEPIALRVGDEFPLEEVIERLAAAAYVRTDLVERRGEFAVRGGLLDVFPPTEDHPVRVEFFGDEVEQVRYFSVADQRSSEPSEHGLWAPACRELLLTPQVRERAERLATQLPGVADLLHKVASGIAVEGMESLAPALVDGMESILDVLPTGSAIVALDPERVRSRAGDLAATTQEFLEASWANAAAGNAVPIDLPAVLGHASHWSIPQARERARELDIPWWSISPYGLAPVDQLEPGADELTAAADALQDAVDHDLVRVRWPVEAVSSYRGDIDAAVADLTQRLQDGWRVLIAVAGPGMVQRLSELLQERSVPTSQEHLSVGLVGLTAATLGAGFMLPQQRLVVLTEADLFGNANARASTKDMRRMPSRRRRQVDPLQLRTGDYVVHEQHGVGRFVQMAQRTVAGATREYLVIEYAASKRGQPGDRLFVPTDQLDQVSKYVGGETPTVHRLGGSDWAQTKSRARRHVKQITAELIRLYSARLATAGHAFSPDTPWQRELEDAFAYVETPDQLSSIDEVKTDMEASVPMDRLICGDVGYGKTEIAVRAAFKAVQDGKQVAVLVPTTLLVQQHLSTFSERYAGFPVRVAALSRFSSDTQARQVLEGLQDGTVDVVIGTHRLLGKDVQFKDLGLVVVDEEQRFGVEHKEQLKALRTAVDVLSMSATPIPRTLEMAVSGIREMSTLATPPEERHPVLTFVGQYDEKQVVAAIHRELLREGQVFFIHNKVATIEKTASRMRELMPQARIDTAHGKMSEHRLEQVVLDFWERRLDVLVCTTIVETGLDISNANTLIVDQADRLGLSQLHQLRGRVGRGRERAYAYILYPTERPLTQLAHDRLQTIASNTDLGAGMAVAMKDLEIRGAGNLLGGEQSGHIAGVGFDLYMRMVGDAVDSFKGVAPPESTEVKIELPVSAHLPHDYIPGERLRLEAYTKLAQAGTPATAAELVAELSDRYGPLPPPAEQLIEVAYLRMLAREVGVTEITLLGRQIRFAPLRLRESQQMRLQRLYPGSAVRGETVLVPQPSSAPVGGTPLRDTAVVQWAKALLTQVVLADIAAG